MDVLRHTRSLALLIFVLGLSSSEHPHRHHHGFRHRRQDHPSHYYYENSQLPEYGNWGPWYSASECSRSCGGGVTFEVRECTSFRADGNPSCLGSNKRYMSCNIPDCPDSDPDFRAFQCSVFDTQPFENQTYSWVPYTKAPNKCELNCMPRGERFYYRQKKQVIDGTLCDDERPDICVNGKCLPVGCDRVLGSPAREDKCRVCGGNGSSCITTRSILDKNDLQVGYNDLLLIPAGATNLRIREIQPSNNYLAIRNLSGHYYLNGDWKIDFPKPLKFVGTYFHYERRPPGFYGVESITALGPITESLYIVILYQEKNTGVEYEYSIKNGSVQATDPDSYHWLYGGFSNCSATCGGGFKIRNVWCAKRRDSNNPVSTDLCDPALEPIRNQTCGTEPCPPDWEYSEWSDCSHGCGPNGTQNRTVQCKQIVSQGRRTVVDNYNCIARRGELENLTRPCNVDLPCPKWYIGPWKACNKLCGDGVHRREVRCYYRIDGKISVTQDSSCSEEKPPTEKPCFIRPCEGVEWILSQWSGCEDKCDSTFETRRAVCATSKGKIYPNEMCKNKLPELVQNCTAPACEYQWYATQWSECSSKCAAGFQTRKVFCGAYKNEAITPANETHCDGSKKYASEQNCTGTGVCNGDWFAGPWSTCTTKCGGGFKTRKVLCMLGNNTVENCDPDQIVFTQQECNTQACGADQIMPVVPTIPISEGSDEEICEEEDNVITVTLSTTTYQPPVQNTSETVGSEDGVTKTEQSTTEGGMTTDESDGQTTSTDTSKEESSASTEKPSVRRRRQASDETTTEVSTEPNSEATSSSTESSTEISDSSRDTTVTEVMTSSDLSSTTSISGSSSTSDASSTFEETSEILNTTTEGSSPTITDVSSSKGSTTEIAVSSESPMTETAVSSESSNERTSSESTTEVPTSMTSKSQTILTTPEPTETSDFTTDDIPVEHTTLIEMPPFVKTEMNSKRCIKKPKKPKCESSEFGCCVDGITFATGPFGAGCPEITTCKETKNGCCPDEVSPAQGLNFKGCPKLLCNETLFGCCPDNESVASGNDFEGCVIKDDKILPLSPPSSTLPPMCHNTDYGCCPDGITAANGPDQRGCSSDCIEGSGDCTPCNQTQYGCCPDGIEYASGPNYAECDLSTTTTEESSSSTEPLCTDCESTKKADFGCHATTFGCCPDNVTEATGPEKEGCGCEHTSFGCCPDKFTPATGHDNQNCPCYSYPFGCCPDGISKAKGPNSEGCVCEETEFGCCGDGKTPALNASRVCGCEASRYGCCLDGVSSATGPNFVGCPEVPINPAEACTKPKDNGPCRDFVVRWYFDADYGGCSRFWYGGCEGNTNRFKTQDECKNTCVEPPGQEACLLPKIKGPCDGYFPSWYYDSNRKQCGQFIYGGCLGNNNRFATFNECEKLCILPDRLGMCEQPAYKGPCGGNYTRWYFDKERQTCLPFTYGGCKGNKNNFLNELSCQHQCVQAQSHPRGPCPGSLKRWYYDTNERACREFDYGGCGGTLNRFASKDSCVERCLQELVEYTYTTKEECSLPKQEGNCTDRQTRWYYNSTENLCMPFYYTGCGGNENNFKTRVLCDKFCPQRQIRTGTPPQIERPVETDIEAAEGRYAVLSCTATGIPRPAVHYQKDGVIIDRSTGRYRLVNGVLEIAQLHKTDAGTYVCVADNGVGEPASLEYRLKVRGGSAPQIDQNVDSDIEAEEGAYTTLRCIASGNPRPVIMWQKGSMTIDRSNGRYKLTDGILQIIGLQMDDAGLYTCIAQNGLSEAATKEFRLTIKGSGPEIDQNVESELDLEEGNYATFKCISSGNPRPSISWQKGSTPIDRSGGRYKITDDTLQIVGLLKSDSGIYNCVAENSLGRRASKQYKLTVRDGVIRAAEIIENAVPNVTVTLNAPAILQCYAYGYPSPVVKWWKEERLLTNNEHYEQRRDHSLVIRHVTLRLLGPYTCQAYNGQGRAVSWMTTLHAVGSVQTLSPEEYAYTIYLIPGPQVVPNTPVTPPPYYPTTTTELVTPRVHAVAVLTKINISQTVFPYGADISIPCFVEGYPAPQISWYKNNEKIEQNAKIAITESNVLVIRNADGNNTGEYKCSAVNSFSQSFSLINIIVEGTYIHPNCSDNQFFANCALIVQAHYCRHQYYGKFCCRSCTLAGQLPAFGEHIHFSSGSSDDGSRDVSKRNSRNVRDLVKH